MPQRQAFFVKQNTSRIFSKQNAPQATLAEKNAPQHFD